MGHHSGDPLLLGIGDRPQLGAVRHLSLAIIGRPAGSGIAGCFSRERCGGDHLVAGAGADRHQYSVAFGIADTLPGADRALPSRRGLGSGGAVRACGSGGDGQTGHGRQYGPGNGCAGVERRRLPDTGIGLAHWVGFTGLSCPWRGGDHRIAYSFIAAGIQVLRQHRPQTSQKAGSGYAADLWRAFPAVFTASAGTLLPGIGILFPGAGDRPGSPLRSAASDYILCGGVADRLSGGYLPDGHRNP